MKKLLFILTLSLTFVLVASSHKGLLGVRGGITLESKSDLPYDSIVEYIQTRGQQWIDTGYVPTSFPNLELRGACPYGTSIVMGMNSPINGVIVRVRNRNDSDGEIGWWDGKDSFVYKATKQAPHKTFTLRSDRDKFVVGSHATDAFTVDLSNNTQSLRLNNARWGTNTSYSGTKIMWFKVWEGEELVLDLVPVRFSSPSGETDGGMYDRVSGRLLKNQGTGTFVVGPDVVEE